MKPIFCLLIAMGLCSIAGGAYFYSSTHGFIERAVEVDGEVLALTRSGSGYSPIVTYTDLQGEFRTLYSDLSTSHPNFFEGEKVKVLYDPDDPRFPVHAKIKAFSQLFLPLFLFIFGGAFVLISSLCWYVWSKGGVVYFGRRAEVEARHPQEDDSGYGGER